MRMLNLLLLVLVAMACLTGNPARGATADIQPLAAISARVEAFLAERQSGPRRVAGGRGPARPAAAAGPVSRASRSVSPVGTHRRGNVTVGVRCAAPRKWTIYVPARVEVFKRVAVLARPVTRGVPLAEG